MTIRKKTTRKPPAYHRKVNGAHHKRSKRYHETYWPYLPLGLLIAVGLFANVFVAHKTGVLSYATDVSVQGLLDDTNTQRSNNGLSGLGLNGQLNNAAQAKANDMSTRDYWSHNTPDGQTPWTFMAAAGYTYRLAGENLAYGFTTSADTLTGWMNSPGHRANILNSGYTEVGFGIINIPNYQSSGPETLVVAMYGTPQTVAAAPVATPTPAPAPATASGSSKANTSGGAAAPAPATEVTPAAETPTTPPPTEQATLVSPETAKKATLEAAPQKISRVEMLTAGNASWTVVATSLLGIAGLAFFLLRHGIAWHKILIRGERYLLKHPLLDAALISLVSLAFILTRTAGHTH